MDYHILAINPGSTSTKMALYKNEEMLYSDNVVHTSEDFTACRNISDQLSLRRKTIIDFLKTHKIKPSALDAVVGRGGILPPVKSGAYLVNETMIDRLLHKPLAYHASNLGAVLADMIAKPSTIPAYIYDSVSVDEMNTIAKITGIPDIPRRSQLHALNMRAAAIKTAKDLEKEYTELNLIVVHLGGGISLSLHNQGRMIDIISDDEGPFAPERSGRIPAYLLAHAIFEQDYTKDQILKMIRGGSGLRLHLGTTDAREVEDKIAAGDKKAEQVYKAMAYTVAKGIGELSTVVSGQVDHIILTGGIAYSERLTGWIKEKVSFIAPVTILAGENELEALAHGVLRVLQGKEKANEYKE